MEERPPTIARLKLARNETHLLEGEENLIGREEDCDVVINHDTLSRRHARITRRGTEWYLEDLGSSNHTFLNGSRMEPMTPVLLSNNCEIHFGDVAVSFEIDTENPAGDPPDQGEAEQQPGSEEHLDDLFADVEEAGIETPGRPPSFVPDSGPPGNEPNETRDTYAILELRSIAHPVRHEVTRIKSLIGSDPAQCDIVLMDVTAPPVCAELTFRPDGRIVLRSIVADFPIQIGGSRVKKGYLKDQVLLDIGDSGYIFHLLNPPEFKKQQSSRDPGTRRTAVLASVLGVMVVMLVAALIFIPEGEAPSEVDHGERVSPEPAVGLHEEATRLIVERPLDAARLLNRHFESLSDAEQEWLIKLESDLERFNEAKDHQRSGDHRSALLAVERIPSDSFLFQVATTREDIEKIQGDYRRRLDELSEQFRDNLLHHRWGDAERTLDQLHRLKGERPSDLERLHRVKRAARMYIDDCINEKQEFLDNPGKYQEDGKRIISDLESLTNHQGVGIEEDIAMAKALLTHARLIDHYWAFQPKDFQDVYDEMAWPAAYPRTHRDDVDRMRNRLSRLLRLNSEYRALLETLEVIEPKQSTENLRRLGKLRHELADSIKKMREIEPSGRFRLHSWLGEQEAQVRDRIGAVFFAYSDMLTNDEWTHHRQLPDLIKAREMSYEILKAMGDQYYFKDEREWRRVFGSRGSEAYRLAQGTYTRAYDGFSRFVREMQHKAPEHPERVWFVSKASEAGDRIHRAVLDETDFQRDPIRQMLEWTGWRATSR